MPKTQNKQSLSEEEYLAGELVSEFKHELMDGEVYAMAGASANHERISTNISSELRVQLKNTPCEPFGSDMKIKSASNFYYPDVIVDCEFDESTPYYSTTHKIIVEVLSKTTRRADETTKRNAYLARISHRNDGFLLVL